MNTVDHGHIGAAEDQRLAELVEEIAERLQSGRAGDAADDMAGDVDEYIARYPEYADRLRDWVNAMTAMADLGHSLVGNGGPTRAASAPSGFVAGVLGDFRIVRELGRGGMGVVYEAEQISLGRRVALKVLPFAAMLDKQQLARFKNEARAAATLDHPNIVAIYSVGSERSVHFYAMQLVEGQSLAQMIAELRRVRGLAVAVDNADGPVTATFAPDAGGAPRHLESAASPTAETKRDVQAVASTLPAFDSGGYFRSVARLGIQAAEALDYSHRNGILHRDVKPANLLVDDAGKLWITDFGLARIEADAGMTMTGDILGTLRYMSPEQALAKRVVVDHRSDIYSLGVTLYELLTLRSAYKGDNRQEVLRQIAFEEPRKPRQINARIPQDLETIVLKAIEKNPADRFATAQELADDLQRFAENRSIRARRPTVLQRARKLIGGHRIAAALVAAIAVLFLMVATAYVADRRRAVAENNRFVEASLLAARAAIESDNVNEAIQRMAEAQERINATQLVDPALVTHVTALKSESEHYAKFVQLYKTARNNRKGTGVIIAPAREALALYQVMEDPHWISKLKEAGIPEAHAHRVSDAVYQLLLQNADQLTRWPDQWPKATRESRLQAQCREAVECLDKAIAFHAPSRGYYWLMANCSLIMGDRDKEKRLRTTALETPPHDAAELFYINRDHLWGTVSQNRGYSAYTFDESYRDHREMLRLDRTYYPAMFYMAYRFMDEHRYAEALPCWYACCSMNPDDLTAPLNRGIALSLLGHYDEAKADFDAVVRMAPENPRALGGIAFILAADPSEKVRDGKRAVELAQKACELTQYKEPGHLDELAVAYAETGNFASAVKWSEMTVELCDDGWLHEEYVKHLESFRQGKPWRDPWEKG